MMLAKDPYETVQLDVHAIAFRRSDSGVLQATVDGTDYEEVALARLYPLSHPDKYILVSEPNGDEIGIIDDLHALSTEAQQHVHHELRLRYVVPIVTKIRKISQEPGMWRWDVATDRGDMRLLLPNLHDHVHTVSDDRLLVSDLDGRRCEVRIGLLDHQSRSQLKKVE